jgi:hypothetical protein
LALVLCSTDVFGGVKLGRMVTGLTDLLCCHFLPQAVHVAVI